MANTIYCFFGATGPVDCHVELDGFATAAFAVEVINSNAGNFSLSKLESNINHAANHRFRVDGPDREAILVLKVACTSAPPAGADVFVLAEQNAVALDCADGNNRLPQTARGVNVGSVTAGKTGIFMLKVIK